MTKTALLLIDYQNDYFENGKWPLQGTEQAAQQAARLLSAFREKNLPIIHVRHENPSPEAPFFVSGSQGAETHSLVAPAENEAVVVKHKANSFKDTELKQVLDQHGIDSLIIVGAMSHMCIDAATRAAADFGYEVSVAHDACATLDMEFNGITVPAAQVHAAFMAALAFGYANIESTEVLIKAVARSPLRG